MDVSDRIRKAGTLLLDTSVPMKGRFRALFLLRNLNGEESIEWIVKVFNDKSDLLKHEAAYCLGQMKNVHALEALISILDDPDQAPIVRHEAAEAIGAIGNTKGIEVLSRYLSSPIKELAETAEIAIERIKWLHGVEGDQQNSGQEQFGSIDPAPPMPCSFTNNCVDMLERIFLDEGRTLWDRYRAMFALRKIASDRAVETLAKGLLCRDSALFRHEVAFVLGQLCSSIAVRPLVKVLSNNSENGMVRHECAEALGNIATEECKKVLHNYLLDDEVLVKESCQVALDICDYMDSSDFQYTTV